MTIEISDAMEAKISELVQSGEFSSKEAFVEAAIDFYIAYEASELDEIRASVADGVEDVECGRLTPVEDFIAELKAERAISR